MKWRIVVQIIGLLTSWVFADMLRNFKDKADYHDLHTVEPPHSLRREVRVRACHPRYAYGAYVLFGLQVSLILATFMARSKRQRGRFTLLSLVATVVIQTVTNVLMPEFDRSWSRYTDTLYGPKKTNVTSITDAPSQRVA